MAETLLDRLRTHIVVGDGAMGTIIYARGVGLDQSFAALNLTQPKMIGGIHREYVEAGAELVETNTFTANRHRLKKFGLESKVRETNRRAVELARGSGARWVVGSVGPLTGAIPEPELELEAREGIFEEQIGALAEAGVDAIMLETFSDLEELKLALAVAKRLTKLAVICQMTFVEDSRTPSGVEARPAARELERAGADVIGSNCGVGPHWAVKAMEIVAAETSRPICCFSNAGRPDYIDGRYIYPTTPEYLATTAERLARMGVTLIGGCCGTTPADVRAIADRLKGASIGPRPRPVRAARVDVVSKAPAKPPKFFEALGKRKPIVVEIDPPRDLDYAKLVKRAVKLCDKGVDAITVGDNPLAVMRLDHLTFCHFLESEGVQTIAHLSCRDRNLIGTQSALLGAAALGVRSILAITGDPAKVGDQQGASSVYDLNSFELIRLIAAMNDGRSHTGASIRQKTGFKIGGAFNPNVRDLDAQIRRLKKKIDAGAHYALSQPLYDLSAVKPLYARLRAMVGDFPVFFGVVPFVTARNAEFLAHEVPGIRVPDDVLARIGGAPESCQREEGMKIACELIEEAYDAAPGFYVIPPFGSADITLEIVEHIRSCAKSASRRPTR